MTGSSAAGPATPPRHAYLRHTWPVRFMHWVNVVVLAILLTSGLQIFNAHPALYWGKSSYSGRSPVLEMAAETDANGQPRGVTTVLGHKFDTTGVLGLSKDADGTATERGFPSWLTLPGSQWLAMGRRWHFFFAWLLVINGLSYVVYTIWSRHLGRDLALSRSDWRSLGRSILDHLKFRHATGEAARRYNPLQKIAYLTVIFILLPALVVMGISMSPALDSVLPGWVDVLGGRQSARTMHFLAAAALVVFVLIHLLEVAVTGLRNNLRSMVTGRFDIEESHDTTAKEVPR